MAWRDLRAEKVLCNERVELVKGIKIPRDGSLLLEQLVTKEHLTEEEVEEIEAETLSITRVSMLLDSLLTRLTKEAFIDFVDALEQRCNHPELASSLRRKYRDLGGTLDTVPEQETQPVTRTVYEEPACVTMPVSFAPVTSQPSVILPPGCDVVDSSVGSEMQFCCCCRNKFFLLLPRQRRIARYDKEGDRDLFLLLPDEVAFCDEFLTLSSSSKWVCRRRNRLFLFQLVTGNVIDKNFPCKVTDEIEHEDGDVTCMLVDEKQNHVLVGTSVGSVVVYKTDDSKLQLFCEFIDNDQAVLGMCTSGCKKETVMGLWRAGGLVEVGRCVLGYEQEYETSVNGNVVTCAFISDEMLAAVVRHDNGVVDVVIWRYRSDEKRTASIDTTLQPGDRVELTTKDNDVIVATPSRCFLLLLHDEPIEVKIIKEWRAQWFKPLTCHEWLACIDGVVRKDCWSLREAPTEALSGRVNSNSTGDLITAL